MAESETWYVVKQPGGGCAILPDREITDLDPTNKSADGSTPERWGPFKSEAEAIARRIGLIRAGKCQPM